MNTEMLRIPASATTAGACAGRPLPAPSARFCRRRSRPPAARALAAPAIGSGPGYHDPRSAFKPLEERDGIVSWRVLSAVTTKPVNNRVVPTFPPAVQALNQQKVKVQGFMMPLEPGEKQRHFLLSAVPTTCGFCLPRAPRD